MRAVLVDNVPSIEDPVVLLLAVAWEALLNLVTELRLRGMCGFGDYGS